MGLGLKYKNRQHIFDEREEKGVPYLSFPLLEQTGVVRHGFSTRLGGVSKGHCATMNISTTRGDEPEAIEENRRRIAAAIGVEHIRTRLTRRMWLWLRRRTGAESSLIRMGW